MKVVVSLLFIFVLATSAEAASTCKTEASHPNQSVAPVTGKVAVLCCCSTGNGGQCCGNVAICTGSFIPGCFCTGAKDEHHLSFSRAH